MGLLGLSSGREADRTILVLANRASPIPSGKEGGQHTWEGYRRGTLSSLYWSEATARRTAELGRV